MKITIGHLVIAFVLLAGVAYTQLVVKTGNDGVVYSPQPLGTVSQTLTTPVLSGTATGTYTLAGTPTIASPTFIGAAPVFSGTSSAVAKQCLVSGTSFDIYLTGTSGLRVSGTSVSAFP